MYIDLIKNEIKQNWQIELKKKKLFFKTHKYTYIY